MVTSSIENGVAMYSIRIGLVACFGIVGLSACAHRPVLSADFGAAFLQDVAGQVADPDAHYAGIPTPGSNGTRAELAQSRYEHDAVIPPSTVGAASTASISGTGAGVSTQSSAPPPAAGQ